jgi:hypothetical protein
MLATALFDEDHDACEVMSPVVPLLYVAVALNCWVAPAERLGLAGETAISEMVSGGGELWLPHPLTIKIVNIVRRGPRQRTNNDARRLDELRTRHSWGRNKLKWATKVITGSLISSKGTGSVQ